MFFVYYIQVFCVKSGPVVWQESEQESKPCTGTDHLLKLGVSTKIYFSKNEIIYLIAVNVKNIDYFWQAGLI